MMRTSLLLSTCCLAAAISARQVSSSPERTAIVLGGGHAAVTAAETLRQAGCRTYLVDYRNHVGGQLVESNHSWLLNGSTGESTPRPIGALQKELFARVMDSGAQPLLLAHCAGLLVENGQRVGGAALATKHGVLALRADIVIDASEEQVSSRHLMGLPETWTETAEYNIELDRANLYTGNSIAIPDGTASIHRTIKSGTLSLSFAQDIQRQRDDWLQRSELERTLRQRACAIVAFLREHQHGFADVSLVRVGAARLIAPERPLDQAYGGLCRIPAQLPLNATTADVRQLERRTEQLVTDFLQHFSAPAPSPHPELFSHGQRLAWHPRADVPSPGFGLAPIRVTAPQRADFQVVIAGGGTGGTGAMWALARQGIQAITVDLLPFMGGTTTGGGVSGAWHGFQGGAYKDYVTQRNQLGKKLHCSAFLAAVALWDSNILNPEHRQTFLGQAIVCDADFADRRLHSVTVYSENGFRSLHADFFIDTTGDADLVAYAGLPFTLGDDDTGWLQSSSCWGLENWSNNDFQGNHYANDFDVVNPTDYPDTMRGLALAHRKNSDFHIAPIYTQRESRRPHGQYHLTIRDILTRQFRTDAIAVASCLCDTHGRLSLDLTRAFLSPSAYSALDREIHVLLPVGTFLPQNTDNLLVAAKALSGERDATSLCRMNPDICNAGFAVGSAAAQLVATERTSTAQLDLKALRTSLAHIGVLPDWALTPETPPWNLDFARQRLEQKDILPALLMPPDDILPVLRDLHKTKNYRSTEAANALAWFGDPYGQTHLLNYARSMAKKDLAYVVDHGVKGFSVFNVNGKEFTATERNNYGFPKLGATEPGRAQGSLTKAIMLLARLDTPESLAFVLDVASRASAGGDSLRTGTTPYAIARTDSIITYAHNRLWAIADFFRRRPTPQAIPILERLLNTPNIGGHHLDQPWSDVPPFQLTYLEIMLADALHRCGGSAGTQRLQLFASDARAVFRDMARRCLQQPARTP